MGSANDWDDTGIIAVSFRRSTTLTLDICVFTALADAEVEGCNELLTGLSFVSSSRVRLQTNAVHRSLEKDA